MFRQIVAFMFDKAHHDQSSRSDARRWDGYAWQKLIPTIMTVSLIQSIAIAAIPAFPGAEGGGAESVGGRGGRIIEVTNLDDAGEGSLRAACEAVGPRIVVFRVAGIIQLETDIRIRAPFLTIAGQTAPGGGITISGTKMPGDWTWPNLLWILTNDVTVRFIRLRYGFVEGLGGKANCIQVGTGGRNVVIDHCSSSWALDENVSAWNTGSNITFSWNIMAEGLSPHSCGSLMGSTEEMTDIDFHHNFLAHNKNRFPLFKQKSGRSINNICYDWGMWHTAIQGGVTADIIGNRYKPGPSTDNNAKVNRPVLVNLAPDAGTPGVPGTPSIYIAGNLAPASPDPDIDNWSFLDESDLGFAPLHIGLDTAFRRTVPLAGLAYPITLHKVNTLDNVVLPGVGASMRLNDMGEFVENRDAVDARIIQQYLDGTGAIIAHENEVGGYPAIQSGTPYPDADHDGMSDIWEAAHSLDSSDPDDHHEDPDGDGYTNIEEFLNGTRPTDATQVLRTAPVKPAAMKGMYSVYSPAGRKIPCQRIEDLTGKGLFIVTHEHTFARHMSIHSPR